MLQGFRNGTTRWLLVILVVLLSTGLVNAWKASSVCPTISRGGAEPLQEEKTLATDDPEESDDNELEESATEAVLESSLEPEILEEPLEDDLIPTDDDVEESEGVLEEPELATEEPEDDLIPTEDEVEESEAVLEEPELATEEPEILEDDLIPTDDEGIVYPTEEIPDGRSFHTTDGELADDEGMDTEGPIVVEEGEDDDEVVTEDPLEVVPTEIDAASRDILVRELRYTLADVASMRPEIALEVLKHRLMRPTEGMPTNWYKEGAVVIPTRRKKAVAIGGAIVGVSLGVLCWKEVLGQTILAMVASLQKVNVEPIPLERIEEVPTETIEEDILEEPLEASGSIRPGTPPEELSSYSADKTWLDKMLTKIEKSIQSFFRIKI